MSCAQCGSGLTVLCPGGILQLRISFSLIISVLKLRFSESVIEGLC